MNSAITLLRRWRFPSRKPLANAMSAGYPRGTLWATGRLMHRVAVVLAMLLWMAALHGCSEDLTIRQYKVAKTPKSAQQTIGAIIPDAAGAWFFKLSGEEGNVSSLKEAFRSLVLSFQLKEGKPEWSLPPGWQEEAGDSFTYAKLIPPGEVPVKATVSVLPIQAEQANRIEVAQWQQYVEMNVNRWREQLQLSKQSWGEMSTELEPLASLSQGDVPAYFVSLQGSGAAGAATPPMMGAAAGAAKLGGADNPPPRKVDFQLPDGWSELDKPLSTMAMRSLEAKSSDGLVAFVTFTSAGGDTTANVARWIGQIPGTRPEQVTEVLQAAVAFEANGVSGTFYTINPAEGTPDAEAICGAIIPWHSQQALFVKMRGPAAAVAANRDGLIALVKSIRW